MREFSRFRGRFAHGPAVGAALAAVLGALAAGCAQQTPPPMAKASEPVPLAAIRTDALAPVADVHAAQLAAPKLSLRDRAPLHYVVRRGDTLWAIAGYFLRDPWQWPALWYENPQIRNPHLIYPGDRLQLVWINGRPRLTAEATDRLHPKVRQTALAAATPAIPYAAIRNFLNGPRLVDADEIEHAPYVVEFTGAHLIGAEGNGIFVKHLPPHAPAIWALAHIGKAYVDPDTGERLGYEAAPVGRATLLSAGAPAKMRITDSDRETQIGDRLLPVTAEDFHADFYPHAPRGDIDGSIISVFGGVQEVGEQQIVTLDRGSADGLDAGAVLRIMQAARNVPDPYGAAGSSVRLPPQPAGLLMVFKASKHLSYALVMDVTRPVHVLDRIAPPASSSSLPRG